VTVWDDTTFSGASEATAARVAAWTPQERLDWMEEALEVLVDSGALQRDRDRRQRDVDALWAQR
jgi:hypothetical protein